MTKTALLLPFLAVSLICMACQQATPSESAPGDASPAVEASSSATPDAAEDTEAEAIEYEPAYPTDVSSEGLSTEDVDRQETTHSHDGGQAHSHDGEPSDDEKGTHDDQDH